MVIWRARNNFIFKLKVPVIDEVFDGIRRLTGKKWAILVLYMSGILIQWIIFLARFGFHIGVLLLVCCFGSSTPYT
jgi:hypothetical protein